METPQSFYDLIAKWPGAPALAQDVGVNETNVRAWKVRGIPCEYWNGVIRSATNREISGITLQLLADLAEQRGIVARAATAAKKAAKKAAAAGAIK